jgi:DNA (cytosine-5)-methyltransferase 1
MTWKNHDNPTLSALDREIISHVPQGGNWQNIPITVPSKRLEQIREMTKERGVVRTTYYGRLEPSQPSYTISTYYNRPGNGTHIHPILDRTLTSREAARLQSFPDSYHFEGNDGAVRNQIGNAVPPLLAYSLGLEFNKSMDNNTCVDVFCGAGGLSLGLEWAGWNIISAIDSNASALKTYSSNREHGEDEVILADLHSQWDIDRCISIIEKKLDGQQLNLLAGGPPCQGFSHAGFRNQDDTRSDLAVTYLTFAERLKPKIFMLENVEGILSMKKGRVISDLIKSLEELGYTVTKPVWKLNAEQYGVPQMRRRVFLLATLQEKFQFNKPKSIFNPCLGRRKSSNLLKVDQSLPQPITVGEALSGLSYDASNENLRLEYADWISGKIPLDEFIKLNKLGVRDSIGQLALFDPYTI